MYLQDIKVSAHVKSLRMGTPFLMHCYRYNNPRVRLTSNVSNNWSEQRESTGTAGGPQVRIAIAYNICDYLSF